MDLEGKLNIFEPASVFQMINLAQATGGLTLDTEFNSARIFFEIGRITFAEITNRPLRLGEYLIKKRLLNKKQLDKALRNKPRGKKLGSFLVQNGALEEATLKSAIKEQIKEVIYEVVRWRSGRFTFSAEEKPKNQDIFIDIPIDHLMLEGLKRMDEAGEKSE